MRSKRSNLEARSLRVEQVMAGLVDERADGRGRALRSARRRRLRAARTRPDARARSLLGAPSALQPDAAFGPAAPPAGDRHLDREAEQLLNLLGGGGRPPSDPCRISEHHPDAGARPRRVGTGCSMLAAEAGCASRLFRAGCISLSFVERGHPCAGTRAQGARYAEMQVGVSKLTVMSPAGVL